MLGLKLGLRGNMFLWFGDFVHFCAKRTGHHVVGEEKTSVTMVLNKILWLEINANTSSNERMPARHRSL